MTAILTSLAWCTYAIGFFFWAISIKLKKQKKIKVLHTCVVFYIISLIFWIARYIVK